VEQWNAGDDPSARKWHFLNCEFYSGERRRNLPAGNRLRDLVHQPINAPHSSNSPRREPVVTPAPATSIRPATRRQQKSRSDHNAAPQVSANMIIVNNYPASVSSHTSFSSNLSQSSSYNQIFTCSDPSNPHMRSVQSRLATFRSGWQASRVRTSPKQLAESGLFYLGDRDRMKCWYCNGGLQNWDYNDDPWFEHAKWFPTCEFLLQTKGPDYVHEVTRQFPNLRRPTIRSSSRNQVLSGLNEVESPSRRFDRSPRARQSRSSGNPIQIIDPRQEVKNLKRKAKEEMEKSSHLTNAAEGMGFKKSQVKAAYIRKLESGSSFRSFEELVECILTFCQDVSSEDEDDDDKEPTTNTPSSSQATLSPNEEVKRLEEEKLCKICRERNFEVVFLPCGHLASCTQCSPNVTHCPICKLVVTQKVRTYAS